METDAQTIKRLEKDRDQLKAALRKADDLLRYIKHRDSQWHSEEMQAVLENNAAAILGRFTD